MLRLLMVVVVLGGCGVGDRTEATQQQSQAVDGLVTYRFTGALPEQDAGCNKPWWMHDSLCGRGFRGYMTVPATASWVDWSGHYAGYEGYGPPYGMVLHVDGEQPRYLSYVTLYLHNDVPVYFAETDPPPLMDYLSIGAGSNTQDGFSIDFVDHSATAIDDVTALPDPSVFADNASPSTVVCEYALGGCPVVTGDAWADFTSIDLAFKRSPVVQPVPYEEFDGPYFEAYETWLDTDRTSIQFTTTIYDPGFEFRGSTCDVWALFEEGDGSSLSTFDRVRLEGGVPQATLTLALSSANPAREIHALNVTCSFALPGKTVTERTFIAYWPPY